MACLWGVAAVRSSRRASLLDGGKGHGQRSDQPYALLRIRSARRVGDQRRYARTAGQCGCPRGRGDRPLRLPHRTQKSDRWRRPWAGSTVLVFTAGIGEHAPEIRRRVVEQAAWLGLAPDEAANRDGGPCLTRPDSKVSAWVIPTDEELMIARHSWDRVEEIGSRRRPVAQAGLGIAGRDVYARDIMSTKVVAVAPNTPMPDIARTLSSGGSAPCR